MPYLTFTPPSGSVPRLTNSPVSLSIELYWMAVNDGRISRLRLVDRSVIPSSTPICAMKLWTSRDIGDQTTFSWFLPLISRTNWKPQRCSTPGGRSGYRKLLNGMAISAV